MTDSRKRQPSGVPIGGQFAANQHDEAPPMNGGGQPEIADTAPMTFGEAKVYMIHDGESWQAHLMVDKDKLPFDHPLRSSADADGFIPIGSVTTTEDSDMPNVNDIALMHARKLDDALKEVPSSRAEAAAEHYGSTISGVKSYPSEVILSNMNAAVIADEALGWLRAESGAPARDKETRQSMEKVVSRAMEAARTKSGEDPNEIARSEVKNLGDRHNDPLRHRALERAAANATERVRARRESVISESVGHRLTGSGFQGNESVRAIAAATADHAYTEALRGSRLGSYEDMAQAGVDNSGHRAALDRMSPEEKDYVMWLASATAMDGHSEASREMF